MFMGDVDSKFPAQRASGLPPSPSRENPGQVFPQSDSKAAPHESVPGTGRDHEQPASDVLGNPYVLQESFAKLDHALTEIISNIRGEENSVGAASNQDSLLHKFEGWRDELTQIRSGHKTLKGDRTNPDTASEGGLFKD